MAVRIVLAHEQARTRERFHSLLERHSGIVIVGQAEDTASAVELVGKMSPDLVILGVTMPNVTCIETARRIGAKWPRVKVVGLSTQWDPQSVSGMLKAGASGYLLEDCSSAEVSEAISTVMENGIHLSPRVMSLMVQDYVRVLSTPRHAVFPSQRRRGTKPFGSPRQTQNQGNIRATIPRSTVGRRRVRLAARGTQDVNNKPGMPPDVDGASSSQGFSAQVQGLKQTVG